MKYLTLTAAAALVLGIGTSAAADAKPQSAQADKCPPARKVHHHKHHAHCHPCAAVAQDYAHWSLFSGVKLGYGFGTARQKDNDSLRGSGRGFDVDASRSKLASRGLVGGLFAGADYIFCSSLLLGLEVAANLSHIQGKLDKRNQREYSPAAFDNFLVKNRVRAEGSFDFAGRIGQKVCDAIYPYFKLGLSMSRFKIQHAVSTFSSLPDPLFLSSSYPNSKHKWRPGLQLGFGFDMPIACNVFFGAEYAHTFYRKISNKTVNRVAGGFVESTNFRARPSTDVVALRLSVRS